MTSVLPEVAELSSTLAELTKIPGAPGAEDAVAEWIAGKVDDLDVPAERDGLGNLVLTATRAPRILITAHMDQVGYMVSRIERDHAFCLPLGDPSLQAGATASVIVSRRGSEPLRAEVHSPDGRRAVLRSERLADLRIGDRAVFATPMHTRSDGRVVASAFDDRIGCLIATRVAQAVAARSPDVAFAWTVREESEQAGILRVARDLAPNVIVALDITYATSDEQDDESVVAVGSGPAITLLDGGMVGNDSLVSAFERASASTDIRWQPEVVRAGVSEAGRVQRTLGIPALALLVPIERPHSPAEVADLEDVVAVENLLLAGLSELTAGPRP